VSAQDFDPKVPGHIEDDPRLAWAQGYQMGHDDARSWPAYPQKDELGQFGHHPDHLIDAEVEVGRLQGLLAEAHGGLLRALDYRAATPEGLSIKHDVRDALRRTESAICSTRPIL
jgi:hypothetical protein